MPIIFSDFKVLRVGYLFIALLLGCSSGPAIMESSPSAAQGDEPQYKTGDVRTVNIPGTEVTFSLVYVAGGSFMMGSSETEEGRDTDEGPQRDTKLDGYWIGQYEVTDNAFSVFRYPDRDADTTAVAGAFYDVNAVSRPSPPYEDPAFGMGGNAKPAVGMTQWGALHFAKWLTQKTGVFFRLPTEAEWENACRAGTDTPFSFGLDEADLDEYGWYEDNSEYALQRVGQKLPNDWGLYDMHGNASEWTMDEYVSTYFQDTASKNPWVEPSRLHPRTVRGGAYDDPSSETRCANRLESTLNWKRRDPQIPKSFWWNTDAPFLGFRLVAPEAGMSEDDQLFFWTMVLGE
ncbi:MAG: SUMF1/EgtB/PvdO family nonheme iron enzyme [Bacteroidetes Order II. Incertae sedis bacterium]|nr:SUMF1/EgtB/PvdO family nonheme iron enzyme [Bacteroidetes Order II. bacterium]